MNSPPRSRPASGDPPRAIRVFVPGVAARFIASRLRAGALPGARWFLAVLLIVIAGCSDRGSAVCRMAPSWADQVARLDLVMNSTNDETWQGQDEMQRAFEDLANVAIPLPSSDEEKALTEQMHAVVTSAERSLYEGRRLIPAFQAVTTVEQWTLARASMDDTRLQVYEEFRRLNSALFSACGLQPVALYRDHSGT